MEAAMGYSADWTMRRAVGRLYRHTGVLKEDFQDTKRPILCCSLLNISIHYDQFVQLVLSLRLPEQTCRTAFLGLFLCM